MTGAVYGWLIAQGLWPTVLASVIGWAIPVTAATLFSRKALARAWRDLKTLLDERNKQAAVHAQRLEEISGQLQTLVYQQQPSHPANRHRTTSKGA